MSQGERPSPVTRSPTLKRGDSKSGWRRQSTTQSAGIPDSTSGTDTPPGSDTWRSLLQPLHPDSDLAALAPRSNADLLGEPHVRDEVHLLGP
jgi:hypothetical protein